MQTTKELYHLKRGILVKYSFFFFKRAVKVLVMHIFISFLMSMSEFMVVLNLFHFP